MYVGRIERLLAYYSLIPMCIINSCGKVTKASGKIADVFKYDGIIDGDIFALTGIKLPEILESAQSGKPLFLKRNDKVFKVLSAFIGEEEGSSVMMYFIDNTAFEKLKEKYNDEKICIAMVHIDNMDELTSGAEENKEMRISTEIDALIRRWAEKLNASISRYREHLYELVMTHKEYEILVAQKFAMLDEARAIESNMDFPVTLSIGMGIGGKTPAECESYAQDALDLALGRGGDQAVVKNVKSFEYYGGKTQSVEKGNKGKSRVIAHALKLLMKQSAKVFIMGHRNPDLDSLGACLGINRVAAAVDKEAYIVIGQYSDTLNDILSNVKATGEYNFVSAARAMTIAGDNDLVVVVDTHRPGLVESIDLVKRVNRTVVIDHHRKSEDSLPNLLLSYMETYASSASELVTEIIQYACDKKSLKGLTKIEADALLAGIMVDTNRFAVKAGVRTFEAASWLRRAGANLENVRRYFQADAESFRVRAACIANAKIFEGGVAMSVCPGENPNAQIVNSQVADELLTIKGIKASFVAGRNEMGKTVVSARSLGDINVQLVMEKFGGGGHFNTAGAQSELSPEELLEQIRSVLEQRFS